MPSKNQKQLNFFLLVKAYKENGVIGIKRQLKQLEGYKPRITPDYVLKLVKTANTIKSADLIDLTSGIEGESTLGDKKDLKVGYWALFRGKYKPNGSKNNIPEEGEFIAQIKRVDNSKDIINFNQNGFRNKYGHTIVIPRRANVSDLNFIYLDYALFGDVLKTGKTPEEVAQKLDNMEEVVRTMVRNILNEDNNNEVIELKSKSHKGNRLFDMLKTAKFQHYDSPKGELSTFNRGEEDRKRIASKLSKSDKQTYKQWLKTTEGKESLKRFENFMSPLFRNEKKLSEGLMRGFGKDPQRKLFKKGDKVRMSPRQDNLLGYSTRISTVVQDEKSDSYGVFIDDFNNISPENSVLYIQDGKIKKGGTIFNDKLPKNKLEIENDKSKQKHIIDKKDLVGYFIKDYVLEKVKLNDASTKNNSNIVY